MNTTTQNFLIGMVQVLLPSLAMYAMGHGWINPTDLSGILGILGTIVATYHSGTTTTAIVPPTVPPTTSSRLL